METETREIAVHPLADLIPAMAPDELEKLVADIREHGLLEPIVLYQGRILDGRHRYQACTQAWVAPRFQEYTGSDPVSYVLSKNLHRRHLSSSQKAAIAAEALPLLETQAKARQGARTDLSTSVKDLTEVPEPAPKRATEEAARLTGTNRQYVAGAKRIGEEAPDLLDAMKAGDITMPEAKALAQQPEGERAETLEALPGMSREERKAALKQQLVRPDTADEPEEARDDEETDAPD